MIFFPCMLFFSKLTFSKISLRNTIRVSNSLNPDQVRHFVGPGLGPNCKSTEIDTKTRRVHHCIMQQCLYINLLITNTIHNKNPSIYTPEVI